MVGLSHAGTMTDSTDNSTVSYFADAMDLVEAIKKMPPSGTAVDLVQ